MDPLVTAGWLQAHLHDTDLAVFDATKYLPTDGKDGLAEFTRAHIPGARFFDIDEVRTRIPACRTWCRRRDGSSGWWVR